MNYYAGIDVSLEESCICVIDANGKVVREGKVSSEPTALIAWLSEVGVTLTRIGLEAGPLSQWLYAAMRQAQLAVELLETRHLPNAWRRIAGPPWAAADLPAHPICPKERRGPWVNHFRNGELQLEWELPSWIIESGCVSY